MCSYYYYCDLNSKINEELTVIWHIFLFRESEGTFQYGNYFREADDLHSVIQHFREANCVTSAILGHSKGILTYDFIHQRFTFVS